MTEEFTELKLDNGVGNYHLSRFRIVFKGPANFPKESFANRFVMRFHDYFNQNNQFAKVNPEYGRKFKSKYTLRFHGYAKRHGIDLGFDHDDWVGLHWINQNRGFTVQTLKRNFREPFDDAIAYVKGSKFGRGLGQRFVGFSADADDDMVEVNRMHFLAGRRSWRLDDGRIFGEKDGVLVLETSAVERFSHNFYNLADKSFGLQKLVPDIWITLLRNFVAMEHLERVPQNDTSGWTRNDSVGQADYYIQRFFPDIASLKGDREFQKARRLFPSFID